MKDEAMLTDEQDEAQTAAMHACSSYLMSPGTDDVEHVRAWSDECDRRLDAANASALRG